MKDERKKQIEYMRDAMLKTNVVSSARASREIVGPMLDECLTEIESLTKERNGLKAIIALTSHANEKENELLRSMASATARTICADCGKPAGAIHNCPEQARENAKVRGGLIHSEACSCVTCRLDRGER